MLLGAVLLKAGETWCGGAIPRVPPSQCFCTRLAPGESGY